jgi:hypothetical protein
MKRHQLTLYSGETITLHEMDNGHFACPVCGVDTAEPAYADGYGLDGEGRQVTPVFAMGSHEICRCCRTQWGDDDYPDEGKTTTEMWQALRTEWLRKVPDRAAAAEQLRNIEAVIMPEAGA